MTDREWTSFDEVRPSEIGVYEWRHKHPLGFVQVFHDEMRMRGAGARDVLSPSFDYWDGYKIHVPAGFEWRLPESPEKAEEARKEGVVVIEGLNLRPCPFCGTAPVISASQCGYEGGGGGITVCPSPQNFNTWRINQCCNLIGFNGFASPSKMAKAWGGTA